MRAPTHCGYCRDRVRYLFPPLTLRRPCNSGSSTGPVLQREDTTNEEDTNEGRHQQEAQLLVARPRRGGPAGAGLLAAGAAIMCNRFKCNRQSRKAPARGKKGVSRAVGAWMATYGHWAHGHRWACGHRACGELGELRRDLQVVPEQVTSIFMRAASVTK